MIGEAKMNRSIWMRSSERGRGIWLLKWRAPRGPSERNVKVVCDVDVASFDVWRKKPLVAASSTVLSDWSSPSGLSFLQRRNAHYRARSPSFNQAPFLNITAGGFAEAGWRWRPCLKWRRTSLHAKIQMANDGILGKVLFWSCAKVVFPTDSLSYQLFSTSLIGPFGIDYFWKFIHLTSRLLSFFSYKTLFFIERIRGKICLNCW